ncbi:hypothetical protein CHLRE_12g507050v5 [Chlamydomonas reinhardtii]|uniref:EF-hand domain-containing protein n=1 Tax=Chlamydomonas reinhardtii TaxID=3055 RepID=A0A2K3D2U9_CHLRE|nr:uncharacterized protein CHLRE_12g507050v5 [Chlamydomonas reinhardtii]PNW74861.1 hypothetical protein CHLRE_12g507050v5 [Chlamydomonas reinhardtii]
MPPLVQAVHDKVKNFVRNSDQFKRVCESTFEALDYRSAGKVSVDDAASCVEALFRELQSACSDYGIVLDPLTSDDVRKIFRECDYDSNAVLDKSEFTDFYSAVVTYAAMRAAAGFGRRYGLGMLAGVAGVVVAKSALRRLPVVGAVASPLLGLLPTIIVGPALGIAAVYGLSQNDLFAIRHKLFPPKQPPMRR